MEVNPMGRLNPNTQQTPEIGLGRTSASLAQRGAGRRNLILVAAAVLAVCWFFASIRPDRESMIMLATELQMTRDKRQQQGKPPNFDPGTVLQSSVEHLYRFTNTVSTEDGKLYQSAFVGTSEKIRQAGRMVITEDGVILWIRWEDGKPIVSRLKWIRHESESESGKNG